MFSFNSVIGSSCGEWKYISMGIWDCREMREYLDRLWLGDCRNVYYLQVNFDAKMLAMSDDYWLAGQWDSVHSDIDGGFYKFLRKSYSYTHKDAAKTIKDKKWRENRDFWQAYIDFCDLLKPFILDALCYAYKSWQACKLERVA